MVFERFNEHLSHFRFKADFLSYCSSQCPEFKNIYTLTTLNKTYKNHEKNNASQTCQDESCLLKVLKRKDKKNEKINSTENLHNCEKEGNVLKENNIASQIGVRLEGKFVSKNVINLSRRNLSASEISLLSKGLKFVPAANKIDRAKLKIELEEYGRKLRLMWHFRNDERSFAADRFRPKSSFNPRNKDVIIETYLSCLEERLLDIEIPSKRFNNLTKEEREALYSLKDDRSIIIKGADKGSAVVVWDREDYLKEAYRQLDDKEVYEQIPDNPSVLANTLMKALEKIRLRGDFSKDTLDYFLVKDPKFARFYLLPKIHKRLHHVPGRPVISNCGYYTENISSFLDYHLQPLAFHPTIKFTAEYSKEAIKFLDVNVRLVEEELMADLSVKPTDTHQFLDPSFSHPYHCKKGIPYSQALRLNRICSDNESFDKRCNDLEGWLMERGYNGKMIRKQILKAREHSRKDLLEGEKAKTSEPRLTFNITYYPVFQNIRNILQELHLLLAPDKEHKKVFLDVPVVGFRNGKSLKDCLVRAALPKTNETGRCEPCRKKTCLVCNSIRTTTTFTTEACGEIQSGPLNCNSEKVLYLLKCKVCGEAPYVGKAKFKFRYRFNNYKSKHRAFRKINRKIPQKCFHDHYYLDDHLGIDDWNFTLFEQCETHKQLKRGKPFGSTDLRLFTH